MTKAACVTCEDCYFRRARLCAIVTSDPCPTFRPHSRGRLRPPLQPALVPRPLEALGSR